MKKINQDVWLEDDTDDVLLKSHPDGRFEVVPAMIDQGKAADLAMALIDAIDDSNRLDVAEYICARMTTTITTFCLEMTDTIPPGDDDDESDH